MIFNGSGFLGEFCWSFSWAVNVIDPLCTLFLFCVFCERCRITIFKSNTAVVQFRAWALSANGSRFNGSRIRSRSLSDALFLSCHVNSVFLCSCPWVGFGLSWAASLVCSGGACNGRLSSHSVSAHMSGVGMRGVIFSSKIIRAWESHPTRWTVQSVTARLARTLPLSASSYLVESRWVVGVSWRKFILLTLSFLIFSCLVSILRRLEPVATVLVTTRLHSWRSFCSTVRRSETSLTTWGLVGKPVLLRIIW